MHINRMAFLFAVLFFWAFVPGVVFGAGAQVYIDWDDDPFMHVAADTVMEVGDTIVPLLPEGFYDDIYAQIEHPDTVKYLPYTVGVDYMPIANYYFLPLVFDEYQIGKPEASEPELFEVTYDPNPVTARLNSTLAMHERMKALQQRVMVTHPELVRYNVRTLPEPPRHFEAIIDPQTLKIVVREINEIPVGAAEVSAADVKPIHWLQSFTGNVQFSQAYVSPNWYQGGSSSLNVIGQAIYSFKLNPAYHPKTLFETTIQYKLAMTDAPDDSLRNYAISEDIFQINSTFGIKARKNWYYSLSLQFKTQLLNNYKANTRTLKSSFMSPGELNVGLGMTYNYTNPKKTVVFDASLAPLAWNMLTCINHDMNPTSFGIKEGRIVRHTIGSTVELKLKWQIAHNILYNSRLFVFSDYTYLQADWENRLDFTINRFLTTQITCNLRYDTRSKAIEDSRWHKLQMKEILSFGFTYKFATAG